MSRPYLHADRGEIQRFVDLLFRYADDGTYASLRAFDQFDTKLPARLVQAIQINGLGLDALIDAAAVAAEAMANEQRPIVFCPPICTFTNPDSARTTDLANGLVVSVEVDEGDMQVARQKLEALLGASTAISASGSDWIDPKTGEIHPKLHIHWRLSEPTRCPEDHEKLRYARAMAARLVDADPTGKPVIHPLRWPGSWNLKSTPRQARIVAYNEAAEIHLDEAIERLEGAIEAAGQASAGIPKSGPPQKDPAIVASAMAAIPNADVHYSDWIRWGYACYRAAGDAGQTIWEGWARKSDKFDAKNQDATWEAIRKAVAGSGDPPRTIGFGTICFHAKAAGWEWPEGPDGDPRPEPPPPHEDPGADVPPRDTPADSPTFFNPWAELRPPPFPIEALPPVLRAFVEDRSRIMGADPCAIAWCAISACSAALHGRIRIKVKKRDHHWREPPAIWVALIGRPSTKKTPIINACWDPLVRAQIPSMRAYEEALLAWHAMPKKERSAEPPYPKVRYLTNDATTEAIQNVLRRQSRGVGVLRDELSGWIGAMEKYGGQKASGADRAFFLRAFQGGEYTVDRVERGIFTVDNLLCTICGGIQPDRLRQFHDLTDDGLWQRFAPIIVGPAQMGEDDQSGSAMQDYADAINRLLQVSPEVRVDLSEQAHEVRADVERRVFEWEQNDGLGARFSSFCGKLVALWARLTLVLNYLDPDHTPFIVPARTAERAATLVFDCLLKSAAQVYAFMGGAGADIDATRSVAGFILTSPKVRVRVLSSDLTRNVHACRNRRLDQIQEIVSPLVAGGWLVPEKEYNPSLWVVADGLHDFFAARAVQEREKRARIRGIIVSDQEEA